MKATTFRVTFDSRHKGYDCSQCGRVLRDMIWEGDAGVYCRQRCADAHMEALDEMKREDEMKQTKQTTKKQQQQKRAAAAHGGARDGAGPKTNASKGLETKTARVTVRFTVIELAALQRDADADECSVAELVAKRALATTLTLHDYDDE